MKDESSIVIYKAIAWFACVVVLTVGGCTVNKQRTLAQMVAGGADPIRASCAIYKNESNNEAICTLIAVKP